MSVTSLWVNSFSKGLLVPIYLTIKFKFLLSNEILDILCCKTVSINEKENTQPSLESAYSPDIIYFINLWWKHLRRWLNLTLSCCPICMIFKKQLLSMHCHIHSWSYTTGIRIKMDEIPKKIPSDLFLSMFQVSLATAMEEEYLHGIFFCSQILQRLLHFAPAINSTSHISNQLSEIWTCSNWRKWSDWLIKNFRWVRGGQ